MVVYYRNHKNKQYKRSFVDLVKEFRISSTRGQWQMAITIGVSLGILLAGFAGLPRTMWVGIAVMSVIQPFHGDMKNRLTGRIWGNLLGGVVFAILYHIMPESLYFTFGIIGGIGVGLSATYGWQAVFNSLGAMTIASEFLGWQGAIFYRVINNVCGVVFGFLFTNIISILHSSGENVSHSFVTSRNIVASLSAISIFGFGKITPLAIYFRDEPAVSITAQPVCNNPGSMPNTRFVISWLFFV